jgi:stearoyl-CoA desaturase (delta-9 desaturase)
MYGTRPFAIEDESRNNAAIALVALGEGWHHNHHAFPTSARHGLSRLQVDPTYALIRTMEAVGLARNVRRPGARQVEQKLA